MTIRRVEKTNKTRVQSVTNRKNRVSESGGGENFAQQLAAIAGTGEASAAAEVTGPTPEVSPVSSEPSPYQRGEQRQQTGELLDTLTVFEQGLAPGLVADPGSDGVRERLRETRDQALRSLSGSQEPGQEREILHRTAVLATVELAKTDRGDYK